MKHWQSLVFVMLVMALLLLPAAGLLFPSTPFSMENPDAYVNENLAFRDGLISLHSGISALVFRQSGSDEVILGKEGWLYFAETLDDYLGHTPLDEAGIDAIADGLAAIATRLESQGKAFIFLCAPNKNTIYPEYMPGYYRPVKGMSDMDRLHAALDARGVRYIDAKAVLLNAKASQQVYHRTDTHWNAYGALCIYREVMAQLETAHPGLAYETYADTPWQAQAVTGDLMRMWLPVGAKAEMATAPSLARSYSTQGVMRSTSDMVIRTQSGGNTLDLCVIRDSFGDALFPYLANNAGNLTFTRLDAGDALAAYAGDADAVVLEIAQRNLYTLAGLQEITW